MLADNIETLYLLANAEPPLKKADEYEQEIKFLESQ